MAHFETTGRQSKKLNVVSSYPPSQMEPAVYNRDLAMSLVNGTYTESACSADTQTIYKIEDVVWAGSTPSCSEVVIANTLDYGLCLFTDKEIQSSSSDEAIYHEHLVHPVLNSLASRPAKRVLIVGGGEGATAREVLKWSADSVASVTWVDIDKPLVDLCRRYMAYANDEVYNDPRLTFHAADIRTFLSGTTDPYDVILLDLPDPDVDHLNTLGASVPPALYSTSFFRMLKDHLTYDGALATHCGPLMPGGNPETRRAGLHWIQRAAASALLGRGSAYRVGIPSFQGDWGFWMSCPPSATLRFPPGLLVMDLLTQTAAFSFPDYWLSSFVGLGSPRSWV